LEHLFEKLSKGPEAFARDYFAYLKQLMDETDLTSLIDFARVISEAHEQGNILYSFGNGGSAAISNHLLCDFSKGISLHTNIKPRVVSLSSSPEIITALVNDVGPTEMFTGQLRNILRYGDICLAVSSSGNSENIISAVEFAQAKGCIVLGLCGFDGGRLKDLADFVVHVPADNYGIVEDLHHSIMHILAQFIRASALDESVDFESLKF
jgi:D-sedoheptulose 7-phosphate isomerase